MQRKVPVSLQAVFTLFSVLATASFAGEAIQLAKGVGLKNPQQPQIAIDEKGNIHVVYGIDNKVCYQHSLDGGKTFSKAVDLSFVRAMSLGMRRGPRIAVGNDGSICISAIGGKEGKGRDGDLLLMRSTDNGKTWTGPVQINDVDGSAREGLHGMAAGPAGEFCCVWLDLRNRSTEVMASISQDGGRTWSKNTLVYRSPTGSVCECCHPSVAFGPEGQVHIQWRNSLRGNRDMYATSSSDLGKTFSKAIKLGKGTWPLDACPMDGGAIAISGKKMLTVWRRQGEVYLVDGAEKEEQLLGQGEQPWLAASKDGPYIVWVSKRGQDAYLLAPGSTSPAVLAHGAFDPVIATGPTGKPPIVTAWEGKEGQNTAIFCQVIKE